MSGLDFSNASSEQLHVDLSRFSSAQFDRGAPSAKEALWLLVNAVLFQLCPVSLSAVKCQVLRAFGANVGTRVVIKPRVTITFPWKLTLGDCVWVGEQSWLLNLAPIRIGSNVCISQRAFLCTGNHDYSKPTFDLITREIEVHNGAWIGASSFVAPGVDVGSHAVLTAGSVATGNLEPFTIYRGNPARAVRKREIR